MQKIVKKFTKILLLIVMILSDLMTPISVLAEVSSKETPNKGDIGINETVSSNNSVTVSAGAIRNEDGSLTNEGDVSITKTVSPVYKDGVLVEGRYNIEFNIKGKDVTDTITTPRPVYVVVVFDRSGSMKEYNYDNCIDYGLLWCNEYEEVKFSAAVAGAKTFATTLLTEIPSAQIALVTFASGTDETPARPFASTNLDTANFGRPYGGTNLHAGLKKANELLSDENVPENAIKYVVVISDGQPTYYVNSNGENDSDDDGNSTSKNELYATLDEADAIKTKTVDGEEVKNAEIFAIGYSLPSDDIYDDTNDSTVPEEEKYGVLTAEDVLTMVASEDTEDDIENNISHYIDANPTAVAGAFTNIATEISRVPAGTDATLTDIIGSNFKIVGKEGNTFTSETISEITESGTTISFEVELDQTKVTKNGWFNTNEGFSLTYTDANGVEQTISTSEDPQVWWTPTVYEYKVNYYKDSTSGSLIATDTIEATNGTVVNSVNTDKYLNKEEYDTIGYELSSVSELSITITDNSTIIDVVYTKKKFNYTVNYYYDGEFESSTLVENIDFGTVVDANSYHDDGEREGYGLDNINTTSGNITIDEDNITIDVYYIKNSYEYTINYHFNNVIDTDFTKNNNEIFGNVIYAKDYHLEDNTEDNAKLENKEQEDNTDYFLDPRLNGNFNGYITIGTGSNILNLYYINTVVKEDNVKDMDKSASIETITASGTPVTYTINYKSILQNVRKDDVVKVVIEDTLPYEIDVNNENTSLNSGINNVEGVVSNNNKTITWTFETTMNEFKELFDASKTFNYTVVYKDIASLSSSNNNTLVNTARGTTFVGNRVLTTDTDTASVEVKINGSLIVHHVDKVTNEELATENSYDLVGKSYSTTYKTDILGYTVDTTSLPSNTNGTYKEDVTEVTYYYVRKDGEIENPSIEKHGPTSIESVNGVFNYEIKASGTIKDYVGKVTLKVTDTLPYAVDRNKSTLDTACVYTSDREIVCTKEYNVTENNFVIDETFNLSIVYTEITNGKVVNNAKSEIILDNNNVTKEDSSETIVEEGIVTAIYVEEGNESNKLSSDETSTGLVGNSYTTEAKEIFGYTLVQEKYPENAKGVYTKEDITVKYVYSKNEGTVDAPSTVKEGPTYVTSVDSIFNYIITAGATIKDYTGKATLKVTDTLPYAVDKNKSTLDTACVYTSDREIVCTKEYNVTENNFIINETFNLSIVYTEITDKKVVNNVSSIVILEDYESTETTDNAESIVDEGTVTAIYVEEGNESNKLSSDETSTGLVGNSYTTEAKEIFGYTLVQEKYPENAEGVYTKEDITVKYVYSKNKGVIDNPIIEKTGLDSIESVNGVFNYEIKASGTIKDYVGKVTLKVTDTLPYAVDRNKSTLDTACVYTSDREIVCTKEYNVTENNFVIDETFNLSIVYTEITNGKVVNNAKSEIILDNNNVTKEDSSETIVEEGTVTAIYVEEGNESNKLSSDETSTGLVGNSYTTEAKEIFGYTLVQEKYPENAEGVYTKEDITVKYVYGKNKGVIDNPIIEKTGLDSIESVNGVFNYEIKASGTIKDYVGKVTLKVTDTLPYAVDRNKSTLDTACVYTSDREIVCTKEYNVTENNFVIDETFNLSIVYTEITNGKVVNNAKSEIILDNNNVTKEDSSETIVEEGTVTAIYVEEGNESNKLSSDETSTGLVGNSYTTEAKEIFGYTLVQEKYPENAKGVYTKEDITVKYVYSKNKGVIDNPIIEKTGLDSIESVNGVFNYEIKASGTIKDYVGKVTLKVTDTLPYAVDRNKSTLDTACVYTSDREIVCTKEYNVTENNFVIDETFNLSIVYTEITNGKVVNNAKSEIILDNNNVTKEDSSETIVEEGTVTAIYVEEGNESNKLSSDETSTGLVGNSYTTKAKEIFGYTLVQEKYPENAKGVYTKEDITVKYVYSKNIGSSKEELSKEGLETVDDINSKFDYTITFNTTIMDYVGEAKLVITDKLPYEIDVENSVFSDNCEYVNGEIICSYDKIISETDNEFNIEEKFELYYINVDKKDVLNRVESVLTYGTTTKESSDEYTSEVKEGTVIVNYVTKENGQYVDLTDSITLTGPVGTSYTTDKKEFDKYNFIEVIGESEGEYIDGVTEVTYVYDLTPLPPQTGVEINPFMFVEYLLAAIALLVIQRTYKTSKNN